MSSLRARCVLLLAACGCDGATDDKEWAVADHSLILATDFTDVAGIGDRVWAVGPVGQVGGDMVAVDGDRWDRIPLPEWSSYFSVFAVAGNDVWVRGDRDVWRWNGAEWIDVALPVDGGEDVVSLGDLGGTAPDDIWVAARARIEDGVDTLYRWNGDSFTTYDELRDLVTLPAGHWLVVGVPCRTDDGTWWATGSIWSSEQDRGDGVLFRFDGDTWTLEGDAPDHGTGLTCDGSDLWRLATVATEEHVDRWHEGTWHRIVGLDGYQPHGVWAGHGEAWIVGNSVTTETTYAQAWRVSDDVAQETMEDVAIFNDFHPDPPITEMRAIWQTDSGRMLAFGTTGFVLER